MNLIRYLLIMSVMTSMTWTSAVVLAQDPDLESDSKSQPDVKWEVRKEYDEHGNLIYYDSSCSHTWKHFDFPGFGGSPAFEDLDSLFSDFFLDSSFFHRPHGFESFRNFPDSAWMDPLFPDSLFPNAYIPFEEFYPRYFHGPDGFFDRHKDWIERFRKEFTFPDDSIHHFHPEWQQLPLHQKKPARVIEI